MRRGQAEHHVAPRVHAGDHAPDALTPVSAWGRGGGEYGIFEDISRMMFTSSSHWGGGEMSDSSMTTSWVMSAKRSGGR
jgi:hypothetical protein